MCNISTRLESIDRQFLRDKNLLSKCKPNSRYGIHWGCKKSDRNIRLKKPVYNMLHGANLRTAPKSNSRVV